MGDKINCARELHARYGRALLRDSRVRVLLEAYGRAAKDTSDEMARSGVSEICRRCAVDEGGSCCGNGIENRFDAVLLLINLLLGCEFPEHPADPTGCWFLGEKGCTIRARHVICVNYLCRRLTAEVGREDIQMLQMKMAMETDAGFMLEEAIKQWLLKQE